MAIIYSYPTVTPVKEDLILGTDVSAKGNPTKNFTIESIIDLVTIKTGDLQFVLDLGNVATGRDINLTNSAFRGGSFVTTGGATVSGTTGVGFTNITSTVFTGTIATAAQPNITSLGALTGLVLNGPISGTGLITNSNLTGAQNDNVVSTLAIKTYVDNKVGLYDTLQEILANGNTTGGSDIVVSTGDDITFTDTSKILMGTTAADNLEIYSDSANSIVIDRSPGALKLQTSLLSVRDEADTIQTISANAAGAVELYHVGDKKIETLVGGAKVTGAFQATTSGTFVDLINTGTYSDSSGDVGTAGQILSSTGTGTNWVTEVPLYNWSLEGTTIPSGTAVTVTDGTNITTTWDATNFDLTIATTGVPDGSGAANQVTYWSDTDTLTGAAGFTFAGGATGKVAIAGELEVGGVLTDGTFTGSSGTYTGYTSITSTDFVGALTGNASTATALASGGAIAITGDTSSTGGPHTYTSGGAVTIPTTIANTTVTAKTLLNLPTPTSAAIAASDTILDAMAKLQGQITGLAGSLAFEGTWNANTDTPTLSGTTPSNGTFYIVSVAGTTDLDGITDWQVGDWAIYVDNGAGTNAWQKLDQSNEVLGSGAANKIAKWTSTNTLATGLIADDGTDVTIGNSGNLIVQGNTTLGDADTDTTSIVGPATMSSTARFNVGISLGANNYGSAGQALTSGGGSATVNTWTTLDNYQYWVLSDGTNTTNISTTDTATFTGASGITVAESAGTITITGSAQPGTGTQYTLPVWSTTSSLGDSMVSQNAGGTKLTVSGNVGIGETNPTKKIDVYQSDTSFGAADFRHVNGNRILINASYNYYDAYNHIFRGLNGTDTHLTIDNLGNSTFAGDIAVTGGDLTLGTDSIASNINAVGDVLGINVDSNTGGGAGANIQLKTAGTTQLTINSSSSTFAGNLIIDQGDGTGGTAAPISRISTGTADGTDNSGITISSAGGTSSGRGAYIYLQGNENDGDARIYTGNAANAELFLTASGVSGSAIRMQTAGSDTLTLNHDKSATFAGNVGIGETASQGKLDILNNGDYDAHTGHGLAINSYAGNAYTSMYMGADDTIDAAYIQSAGRNTSFTTKTLLLNPNGGNVGIGTSTIPADHILQVSNEGQSYARVALTNSQTGNASGDGLIFQMESLNSIIKNQENGYLGFGTNGRESDIRIDSSGNVGIGIDPSYKLEIKSSGAGNYIQHFVSSDGASLGGFYENADTDALFFLKNASGAIKVEIDSDGDSYFNGGNVGIGTDSPAKKLEVAVTGNNQASTVRIQGTDGNGAGHPLDLKMDGATDSFSILIGQGGGATPSTVLFSGNRNGNVTFAGDVTLNKITTSTGLEYQVRNTNGASGNHVFKSYNTAILTLDGGTNNATFAGNVGINYTGAYNRISSTETTLAIENNNIVSLYLNNTSTNGHNQVLISGSDGAFAVYDETEGANRFIIDGSGNVTVNSGNVQLVDSNKRITVDGSDIRIWQRSAADIQFLTNDLERLRIESNGTLALPSLGNDGFINFNSTDLELDVNRNPNTGAFSDTAKSHARISLSGPSGGSTIKFMTSSANNTVATQRFSIDGNGQGYFVGGMRVGGLYITALQGNAQLTNASTSSGSNPSYIGQGLISVSISDAKAKENFSDVQTNECLDKIVSLADHVKKFDWIDEDWNREKGRTVGMVAQEIYEDHSEFVHKPENYDDDGWAIRYQEIVPTLIKSIQELKADNDSLKARIETLENN